MVVKCRCDCYDFSYPLKFQMIFTFHQQFACLVKIYLRGLYEHSRIWISVLIHRVVVIGLIDEGIIVIWNIFQGDT